MDRFLIYVSRRLSHKVKVLRRGQPSFLPFLPSFVYYEGVLIVDVSFTKDL